MRLALLTKRTADEESLFFRERTRLIAALHGRQHDVGIIFGPEHHSRLGTFDLAVAFYYPHILQPEEYLAPRLGTLNIHPGFLPFGRGAMPNVWSIVDCFPAGVAVHVMTSEVDCGDVIARRHVPKFATDTGETLYHRLLTASVDMFINVFPMIEDTATGLDKGFFGVAQPPVGDPQYPVHRKRDVGEIDDLERVFGRELARQFVNILRARTFSAHESAYIRGENGEKIFVRVLLSEESE